MFLPRLATEKYLFIEKELTLDWQTFQALNHVNRGFLIFIVVTRWSQLDIDCKASAHRNILALAAH